MTINIIKLFTLSNAHFLLLNYLVEVIREIEVIKHVPVIQEVIKEVPVNHHIALPQEVIKEVEVNKWHLILLRTY